MIRVAKKKISILITDGEYRAALAATRSLGRKGYRIVVAARHERNLSSCSRFCSLGLSTPDPAKAGSEYSHAVRDIVIREKIDVVLPITEVSIYLLNEIREKFPPNIIMAFPPAEKMAVVSNKVELLKFAENLNVPIPHTYYLSRPIDLPPIINKIVHYPVVVKPALSRLPTRNGRFLSGGVRYAASRAELDFLYQTSDILQYPSMIQEKIDGPGTGLFLLYDGDKSLATFSHRRLREKPPSGGVSVVCESVPLDEKMLESADKLLKAVGWQGVAMVEFKRDKKDGEAKLMEINGRFWGSLQLAVVSGVNFPSLYIDYLYGKSPSPPIRDYKTGQKLKWFFGTLDHLLIRLKNRDSELYLPGDAPSRFLAVYEFLKIWEKDSSFDTFNQEDVLPFIHEATSFFKAMRGMT